METELYDARINGRWVRGKAHLQADPNQWIGIFRVVKDLFKDHFSNWRSAVINYRGPFHAEEECTTGRGKAKILFAEPAKGRFVYIHVEGIEEPELENDIRDELQEGYCENL